jgi:hypothetical protein
MTARAHANVVVFKESFSAAVHDLVIKRIPKVTDNICKISNPKHQVPGFQVSEMIELNTETSAIVICYFY